jgi:2-polyprenyl-3-methyl-5-hydroxy-6-metoxy-1,4-benzoquinol methylase
MAAHIGAFMRKYNKKARILEAGVGNGLTLFLLKEQGFEVVGIDLMEAWCALLEKKYNMRVTPGAFEDIVCDVPFDLIYSSHTIEHSQDPHKWFSQALRLLKPGGYFWLDTPDTFYLYRQSGRWHHLETRHPFEHLCILSLPAVEKLAREYGFHIIEIQRQVEFNSMYAIMQKPFESAS